MNRFFLFLTGLLLASCIENPSSSSDEEMATLPTPKPGEAVATFGGGCFWSVEHEFESLKGVREAVSGYAGGSVKNPTYRQVGSEQTGHAEAVQVYYDPNVISFRTLLDAFFAGHDPTTLNRQGPDVGTQYRSVAFYRNSEEKKEIEAAIQQASQHYGKPVVTQVVPFDAFYSAENYHQRYYDQHPLEPYVAMVCRPKVTKFREAMAGKLKAEN